MKHCEAESWKRGQDLRLLSTEDIPKFYRGRRVTFIHHTSHELMGKDPHCCAINIRGHSGGPCVERARCLSENSGRRR